MVQGSRSRAGFDLERFSSRNVCIRREEARLEFDDGALFRSKRFGKVHLLTCCMLLFPQRVAKAGAPFGVWPVAGAQWRCCGLAQTLQCKRRLPTSDERRPDKQEWGLRTQCWPEAVI